MNLAEQEPIPQRKDAVSFVIELVKYNRQAKAYSEMHPIVVAAAESALKRLSPLTEDTGSFTLGVAHHAFMAGGDFLERNNVKLGEYAALLSALGIITVTFSGKLRADELHRFALVTNRPRDDIWKEGGIKRVLAGAGVRLVKVQGIDPGIFSHSDYIPVVTGGEHTDLWESLLHGILNGTFPCSRERLAQKLNADPAKMASWINSLMSGLSDDMRLASAQTMAASFSELAHEAELPEIRGDLLRKYLEFVTKLSPQLRRDFLSTFLMTVREDDSDFGEELFNRLPYDVGIDALNTVVAHTADLSHLVLKLMNRLAATSVERSTTSTLSRPAELGKSLEVLFRQDEFDKYVPIAYQSVLAGIITNDRLAEANEVELTELRKTMQHDQLEAEIADVITEIMRILPLEEQGEGLHRSLAELIRFFLKMGDFTSLAKICTTAHVSIFTPPLVSEILDSAGIWKERLREIHDIIVAVGQPFIDPLMEGLATTNNVSLRRFYFDCLNLMGEAVRGAAIERLHDNRWFFVRNLLLFLRPYSDPEVQRAVRRLIDHPHPKVRFEAVKSALLNHDPAVGRILVQELESNDPVRQIDAVQLAELSRSKEVFDKLLLILECREVMDYNLDLKRAAVNTLAAIGDLRAIPHLERVLRSSNLLHPVKHGHLRRDIISSFRRYPADGVRSLIDEFETGDTVKR